MPKNKQSSIGKMLAIPSGVAGIAVLKYRPSTTIPFTRGGSFDWKDPQANNHGMPVKSDEAKWAGNLPKGWDDSSRSKFYDSMSKEGPTTNCMKNIDGHVDDPGAFCASLRDRVTGDTHWRSGGKKK